MTISSYTFHAEIFQHLHFLHIPKTAGTSLRTWLLDLFAEGDWLPCHYYKELQQFTPNQISQYRFFSGHLGINWYELLPTPPCTITWLREPVSREISQYLYLRRYAAIMLGLPISPDYVSATNQLSLAELCQSPVHEGYYDNLQVRYLAGAHPSEEQSPIFCNEEMLTKAKENLLNLFFFGICESMEDSISLFNYYFSCPPRPLALSLNKTDRTVGRDSFTEEEMIIIQRANQYDLKLYSFAESIFLERLNVFKNKLTTLQNLSVLSPFTSIEEKENDSINAFLKYNFQMRQAAVPRLNSVTFNFSESIFLSGWYPRFYYDPIKKWLRWAGPETTSSIYLPLAANIAYAVSFQVYYVMSIDILESLSLWIGGIYIALDVKKCSNEGEPPSYRVDGRVPKYLVNPDYPYTELKFKTLQTLRHWFRHMGKLQALSTMS